MSAARSEHSEKRVYRQFREHLTQVFFIGINGSKVVPRGTLALVPMLRRDWGEGFLLSVFMKFTKSQHQIWNILWQRQIDRVYQHACKDYLNGLEIVGFTSNRVPNLTSIHCVITPRTKWKTIRTNTRYSDAIAWYQHFAKREFLITDYLRSMEELDFTPEPDMFHDIFGHLPYLTFPHVTELLEMFAPAFHKANSEQRENIKRLAWFSYEFGLIRENGEVKAFGAGLMSSSKEMDAAMTGTIRVKPFTIKNVLQKDKAIWNLNEELFIFNSLEELKREIATYFNSF